MKKNKRILVISLIVITFCAVLFFTFFNNITFDFSINEYSQELSTFSNVSNDVTNEIKTAAQAKSAAFKIWKQVYGDSVIFKLPYRVYYDSESHIWLVKGSWVFFIPGGPHILLKEEGGEVLAVWHDKA